MYEFFDIIVLLVIAAFFIGNLYNSLGKNKGEGTPPPKPTNMSADNSSECTECETTPTPAETAAFNHPAAANAEGSANAPVDPVSASGVNLSALKEILPAFEEKKFITNAEKAFEYIVTAFHKGEFSEIEGLLDPGLMEKMREKFAAKSAAGHTTSIEIVSFPSVKIMDCHVDGAKAFLTVEFISEQIHTTKDKSGAVIEGRDNYISRITDTWVFTKDTRQDKGPAWILSRVTKAV